MTLDSFQWPTGNRLADAYIHQSDPDLLRLFAGHPSNVADWQQRAGRLDSSRANRPAPAALAAALRAYNENRGASEQTLAQIEALRRGALTVVGGQQAGLWTGPLLVLYKAVTVIQTARTAAARLQREVVPVFWLAGEDHDWDEAAQTYVSAAGSPLSKLALRRPPGLATSISRTPISPEMWEAALQQLAGALPDAPCKSAVLAELQAAASRSAQLTDLNAQLLLRWFGPYGLVVMDADDPAIRRLEAPMFTAMLRQNEALRSAYQAGAQGVRTLGYPLQVEPEDACMQLFWFEEQGASSAAFARGARILLYATAANGNGNGATDRRGRLRLTEEQLLQAAEETPWRLSNNVLSRPLMQEYLLPVLATVLGPAELAYWAVVGHAFSLFHMNMPLLVPRPSFTLIEPSIGKLLAKYELTVAELLSGAQAQRASWLNRQQGAGTAQLFHQVREAIASVYDPVLEAALQSAPELKSLAEANRERLLAQVDYMRSRVEEAHRGKHAQQLQEWQELANQLSPTGRLQERRLNATAYFSRYGNDWLEALLQAPVAAAGEHHILYLS